VSIPLEKGTRALLECGVATVLGTRDADLAPEVTRGWGLRVLEDGLTLEVCVGLPSGGRTLRNLAENGHLAMTCVRPSDYRQVQFKGRLVATLDPTPEDRARVARHQEAFTAEVEQVGIARQLCSGFWSHDDPAAMVKLRFVIEEGYDQTPGPDAGRPL
jgi:hypothetical protein